MPEQSNPSETQERLYTLQGYEYDSDTGICTDGTQVVIGLLCPFLVTFYFDRDGLLLCHEKRLLSVPFRTYSTDPHLIYDIYDPDFRKDLNLQKQAWQEEMGFINATSHIRAFYNEEYPVGIEELPEHYTNLGDADWFSDEEEREESKQERDQWIAEGKFVWWWAKDYYMSKDGEVEST